MTDVTKTARRIAGYTIDQTILIVAIIAILITLIIATVGWDLLQKTGGTKAGAQVRQIEDANASFFARHNLWPDDALGQSGNAAAGAALALASGRILKTNIFGANLPDRFTNRWKSLLSGYRDTGAQVNHSIGGGGFVAQYRIANGADGPAFGLGAGATGQPANQSYMIVRLDNVPVAEAANIDDAIDGTITVAGNVGPSTQGRVLYTTNGTAANTCAAILPAAVPANGSVGVCYIANPL